MKRTAPAAILLATGLIAGCSTSEPPLDQNANFQSVVPVKKSAENTLEVPPDLTAPQIQNKYTIPAAGTASASQMASAMNAAPQQAGTPADGAKPVVVNVDQVKLMRAGTERWLVVGNKTPAQLWPLLKAFWQDNGFTIKSEEPEVGVMETDWAENRAKLPNDGLRKLIEAVGLGGAYSTSQRDMFRIRLEKNDTGGTEVYFSNRGIEELFVDEGKSQTKWQPRPADPELEAEMLGRFMVRLGASNEQAKAAVKQAIAPAQAQVAPITNATLTIGDDFDRAWRRVGLALDRIGLVVADRDRSQGIYYVKPAKNELDKPEEKSSSGGFWSRLWGGKEEKPVAAADDSVRILVKELQPGKTTISMIDKQGQPVTGKFAQTAMQKLQGELQ